jgi:DNA polymerase-3 subunit alpha
LKNSIYFKPGIFVALKGRIEPNRFRNNLEFNVHSIELLDQFSEKRAKNIHLNVPVSAINNSFISEINDLFAANEGKCAVQFTVYDPVEKLDIQFNSKDIKVDPNKTLTRELERLQVSFKLS